MIKRRGLVLGILASPLVLAADTDFFKHISDFDKPYQTFINHLCNWKQTGDKCDVNLGQTDYKAFKEARKAAIPLFDLADKS